MASVVETAWFKVTRLSGALGAEIRGTDLRELGDEGFATLRELLLEHLVLFFPDQQLNTDGHVALGRRFGELHVFPRETVNLRDYPEVFVIEGDRGRAGLWHTDSTFEQRPPFASILRMVTAPTVGGDTMWSNQYLAYERLSDRMREFLDDLSAVHTLTTVVEAKRAEPLTVAATHPVVTVHPETGRRSLFVNRSKTERIVELSERESDALLSYLFTWSEQPEFQCRYKWTSGTIAIWDNRCTQHCAVADYSEYRRIERVAVIGDQPQGVR